MASSEPIQMEDLSVASSHATDFTESNYRRLLRLALDRYDFESFGTASNLPHVLWRHDVDFSVHRAARLATIEAEEGAASTFFFQLGSAFYNLFEVDVARKAQEIVSLGHAVGLHFDVSAYPVSNWKLEEALRFEKETLEKLLGRRVEVFSLHNPTPQLIESLQSESYCGMINTYSSVIRETYAYCSDSNGYWRFRRLEEVLNETPPRLHVLTHPGWWVPEPMSPYDRVQRVISGRANATRLLYDSVLETHGRLNLGRRSE